MKKHIPYDKLSKKEQRKIDQAKRNTWGPINPATRKPQNSKASNRSKALNWKCEIHETGGYIFTKQMGSDDILPFADTWHSREAHGPAASPRLSAAE